MKEKQNHNIPILSHNHFPTEHLYSCNHYDLYGMF